MFTSRANCRSLVLVAGAAGLLAASGFGGGCNTATAYRLDPTPGVRESSFTQDDQDNRVANTIDTNLRKMNEDLGRLFLLDRPSRLGMRSVPY